MALCLLAAAFIAGAAFDADRRPRLRHVQHRVDPVAPLLGPVHERAGLAPWARVDDELTLDEHGELLAEAHDVAVR